MQVGAFMKNICLHLKLFTFLGGMIFIAIPFLTYDGPAETDGISDNLDTL